VWGTQLTVPHSSHEQRERDPRDSRTFRRIFDYNKLVLKRKPVLQAGRDLRDLPTYTIPEAARFLAIPERTMPYWYSDSSILRASGNIGDISLLSFRDVAEAYVLELLRTFYGFHSRRLRYVVENFRKETETKRPLLDAELYVVLGNLVLKKPARGKQPLRMVDLAHERNLVFPEFVAMVGKRVLKDSKHAPRRIYPWRFAPPLDDSRPISMDPHVMSGRAVLTGTRIPITVLIGMKRSGKTPREIARSYHVDPESVEKALLHLEKPLPKVA
jgi:uncharacterized protein (DUF433 family)